MKILPIIIAFCLTISPINLCCADDVDDEKVPAKTSGFNSALTGALLGGLLGGGIGTAIGSASGHAGTGAAIGAGIGAVGGSLFGAAQGDNAAKEAPAKEETASSSKIKAKKRVIREYDEEGNVISEKEVKE